MMKRRLIAVLLFSATVPLLGGAAYEFASRPEGGGRSLAGRARVEGRQMRIDFTSGDGFLFRDSSIVLSQDGGKTVVVVDPLQRRYYILSLDKLLSAMTGAVRGTGLLTIHVTNVVSSVRDLGYGGVIDSYRTHRYALEASYDLSLGVVGAITRAHIHTHTETWTTDKIDSSLATFVQQGGLRTGEPDLDRLLDASSRTVYGFPLRQVTTTTLRSVGGIESRSTQTVEISHFQRMSFAPSLFEIPAGYRQTASPFGSAGSAP
jgi:hypothetical protein